MIRSIKNPSFLKLSSRLGCLLVLVQGLTGCYSLPYAPLAAPPQSEAAVQDMQHGLAQQAVSSLQATTGEAASTTCQRSELTWASWVKPEEQKFWESFADPHLLQALKQGTSNQINTETVLLDLRRMALFIQQQNQNFGVIPYVSGSYSNTKSGIRNDGAPNTSATAWSFGLGVTYELDVWGTVAARRQQSVLQDQMNRVLHDNLRLLSQVTLANLYWQSYTVFLLERQARYYLNTAVREQQWLSDMMQYGIVAPIDVTRAAVRVKDAQLQQEQQTANLERQITALALALQTPAHCVQAWTNTWTENVMPMPEVALTQSTEVLLQSPAMRLAELELQLAWQRWRVSQKEGLANPSFNLGVSDSQPRLQDLFQSPVWTLATSIAVNVNPWAVALQRQQGDLDYANQQLSYEKTLLQNLQNLQSTGTDYLQTQLFVTQAQAQAQQAETEVKIVQFRQSLGEATNIDFTLAQQTYQTTRLNTQVSRMQQAVQIGQLFLLHGGQLALKP